MESGMRYQQSYVSYGRRARYDDIVGCGPGTTNLSEIENLSISNQQEGIWVTGQGKVTAVPDIATLRLGIEAQEVSVVHVDLTS